MSGTGFITFILLVALSIGIVCELRNDGSGDDNLGDELNRVSGYNQQIGTGLSESAKSAERIADGIKGSRERIGEAAGQAGRVAEYQRQASSIIGECQCVLEEIRRRAEKKEKNP